MSAQARRHLPAGGIKATLVGGNTIGGALRERAARSDGHRHVDTPALVRRLTELSANTYLYGSWDSPTDWDDLRPEFLPAAQAAGIDVIAYIVPPSETFDRGRASRPFTLDFVRWAKEFATLSLEYPALKAWAIDDVEVGADAELFTADCLGQVKAAQDEVNSELACYTSAYFGEATREAFLDKHAPYIDGIIYPFLDGHHNTTTVASSLPDCLDAILELTDPRELDLILLIYTGRFLDAPLSPTETHVADTLQVGASYPADGRITGVIAYGTQQDGAPAPPSDNRAMYGAGRLSLTFRWRAEREVEGWYLDIGVDNLETVGLHVKNPGLEHPDEWELTAGPRPLKSVIDLYAADRPARILDAVRRGFDR